MRCVGIWQRQIIISQEMTKKRLDKIRIDPALGDARDVCREQAGEGKDEKRAEVSRQRKAMWAS